ncbi:hypothetical protein ACTMTJ_44775 [Phytohabitans sp. LJ34]|uniref:hypothetical protein n=1 Tax=Phytohabitans sp. LJ34 TaxID=3452217 RepID=UPI003F8CB79B
MQAIIESPGVPPLAFALAFAAGAGHAVTPGHGKSLAAAYLVGSRGRIRDAAWLGGSVAVMHTLSVLVIGLLWTFLSLSDAIRLEELTRWLQLGAGLLVVERHEGLRHRRPGHVPGQGLRGLVVREEQQARRPQRSVAGNRHDRGGRGDLDAVARLQQRRRRDARGQAVAGPLVHPQPTPRRPQRPLEARHLTVAPAGRAPAG